MLLRVAGNAAGGPFFMTIEELKARALAIEQDVLTNHLPRIKEGFEKGYVDENQLLVIYDHAVRARVMREMVCQLEAEKRMLGGSGEV